MSIELGPSDGVSQFDPTFGSQAKTPFGRTVTNIGRDKDFDEGFVVTEFIDGSPNDRTQIRLVGNLMPFQPFPWSREQRLVKEYYPGNPEAAVQVLGVKEGELIISGRFKDKRYRDPSFYGVSYQFARAFEEMVKRGNLLRFGMRGIAGNWERYGFLEKSSFKMNKLSWVDYELTFFVVSDKKPKNNYFSADEKTAPNNVNQQLISQATFFNGRYSTVPSTVPISIAGIIENAVSAVASKINIVTNFVESVITSGQDILAASNRALGLIKNCRLTINKFQRQVDFLAHDIATFSTSVDPVKRLKDFQKGVSFITQAISSAHGLQAILAQLEQQFKSISTTVPKARYKVQVGDTLQKISVRFYKVSSHWDIIQTHNKLQTTQLIPGKILEIPNL